jgi:hypothetical protein
MAGESEFFDHKRRESVWSNIFLQTKYFDIDKETVFLASSLRLTCFLSMRVRGLKDPQVDM